MAGGDDLDFRKFRDQLHKDFDAAQTEAQRVALIELFVKMGEAYQGAYERGGSDAEPLAQFKAARQSDYLQLLLKEAADGARMLIPEVLLAIIAREIWAGRTAPDAGMRKIAIKGVMDRMRVLEEALAQNAELDRMLADRERKR
ncbi:MAG: hypothetical protein WCD20_00750 [Rhodomicrobium sp.]